jgi:hypothetical protein
MKLLPPCEHNPLQALVGPWSEKQCRVCWKFLNSERHRSRWEQLAAEQRGGPSLLKRAGHFALAVGKHLLNGMRLVSTETYTSRMSICKQCPMLKAGTCLHGSCGCAIANKARWESERCPIDKW